MDEVLQGLIEYSEERYFLTWSVLNVLSRIEMESFTVAFLTEDENSDARNQHLLSLNLSPFLMFEVQCVVSETDLLHQFPEFDREPEKIQHLHSSKTDLTISSSHDLT